MVQFRNRLFSGLFGRNRTHFNSFLQKKFFAPSFRKTPIIVEAEELIKWKISLLKVPKKTTWAICIAVKVGKNIIVECMPQIILAQDKKVTDLISVRRVRTKTLRLKQDIALLEKIVEE